MIDFFKSDYHWMLREAKGLHPWIQNDPYRLFKFFNRRWKRCFDCFEIERNNLARDIVTEQIVSNQMIDLFIKALIRAEIRFISRYVPQRSHEERLTGNLVSEIDNSIFMIKDLIEKNSLDLYGEAKTIDFFYKDLSRGGKIEKNTGADLGFILVLDLPDYPLTIKSIVLQAKKIQGSAQIDNRQFEILKDFNEDNGGYLFYDMDFKTLTSPLILKLDDHDLANCHKESQNEGKASFSFKYENILDGYPLSLFLYLCLFESFYGKTHHSFKNALQYFDKLIYQDGKRIIGEEAFNGRLGIVSVGKKINYSIVDNEVLSIDI